MDQRTGSETWTRRNGRLTAFAAVALFLGALGSAGSLAAQAPAGGYRQSCRSYSVDMNDTLSALCKDRGGNEKNSTLDHVHQCKGDIANYDGVLRCSKGTPPPAGSYQASCRDYYIQGITLIAQCKDNGGNYKPTQLFDFGKCRDAPYNFDGALTCFRGTALPPPGSYAKSCKDIVVNGVGLSAQCRRVNGAFIQATLPKFSDCTGINNFDGALICSHKPFGG